MLLRPRRFAFALIGLAAGLFALVAGANILIDPQAIFGTGLGHIHQNANLRVLTFLNYRRAPQTTDGLFFASSRGRAGMPIAELSQRTQANMASFAVDFGMITDHLPVLDYVIRDKAARGERLRVVVLLLDLDLLGQRSFTNRTMQTFQPPAISGESAGRFWWRYLTAVQFQSWRNAIWPGRNRVATRELDPLRPAEPRIRLASADPDTLPTLPRLKRVTGQPEFASQLTMLQRFIDRCREHDIQLIIATSPLHRDIADQYDRADMAAARDAVARMAPIWDFDAPEWLSDRKDLWSDYSHFTTDVGHMMLDRMFDGRLPAGVRNFGTLQPPKS